MTFASVLFFCLGGIAVCVALVFAVETLVAFCLHEKEPVVAPRRGMFLVEAERHAVSTDQAA